MARKGRPLGISIVAVVLLLTAFNSVRAVSDFDGVTFSEWLVSASTSDYFNAAFNLAYLVVAVLCAIGLWEMHDWAMRAYIGWAGLFVIGISLKDAVLKLQGYTATAWWLIALVPIVMSAVLALVGFLLNRSLATSA